MITPRRARAGVSVLGGCLVLGLASCSAEVPFSPQDPGRGPGNLVGDGQPVSSGVFAGDGLVDPAPAAVAPATGDAACGADCQAHCAGLALENPVDEALCPLLWGVGLDTRPVLPAEACRRLFVDLVGRFPTRDEAAEVCGGRSWGEVARRLMADGAFVEINQRRWADRLLYDNEAVSLERIFDMDELVGKVYRGLVAYDQFAAVLSAHPVLTRRRDTPGDRAEAVFALLLGRPPYESERADLGRLYALWENGYYDHPRLGMRLPDAFIAFQCLRPDGTPDPIARGECTSVLWGFTELILTPDIRAQEGRMWSGLLRAEEWSKLQAPGRILARQLAFWERAADDVLHQYLGYDLGALAPAVRERLVAFFLRYGGDVRALHHAVVTSQVYLQSASGASPTAHRFTYGPLKQIEVEPWIDSVQRTTGYSLSRCDHRLPDPESLLESGSVSAYAVVDSSRWDIGRNGRVVSDYRNLARTLGGCPDNTTAGRFKTISILTTATQEGFVKQVCNPGLASNEGADVVRLLPPGIDPRRALDPVLAESIFDFQVGLFFGREMTEEEREAGRQAGDACAPKPCSAESFARPACYALLSSGEMIFY